MTHKIVTLFASLALLAGTAGCIEDGQSIHLRNVMGGQPDKECTITVEETMQKSAGALDVGLSRSYIAGVLVDNALLATDLQQGGDSFNRPSRNDFHISEIQLRYETHPGVPGLKDRKIASSGTVRAGGLFAMGVNLVTFDTAEILANQPIPAGGIELRVFMRLKGTYLHGAEQTTSELMFPITIFNRGAPSCGPEEELALPEGGFEPACGNTGQDGSGFICKKKEATGP